MRHIIWLPTLVNPFGFKGGLLAKNLLRLLHSLYSDDAVCCACFWCDCFSPVFGLVSFGPAVFGAADVASCAEVISGVVVDVPAEGETICKWVYLVCQSVCISIGKDVLPTVEKIKGATNE